MSSACDKRTSSFNDVCEGDLRALLDKLPDNLNKQLLISDSEYFKLLNTETSKEKKEELRRLVREGVWVLV